MMRFRSLASRMAAVAVLQLILLMVGAAVIVVATKPLEEARPEDHLHPGKLSTLEGDALYAELDRLRRARISVSIYNAERQLIATNVDPPLAVPPRPRFKGGGTGSGSAAGEQVRKYFRDRPFVRPFRMGEERGLLVARGQRAQPPGWTGPILILITGFSILVLGAIVTARWIVRPIQKLSETARALGAGDLTARSRLARSDEIGELGARFDEMADRIATLMRSEKELFANVAHELRTPLARIGVALDLAAEGDARAARASLDEIAADVAELERIVDDVLSTLRFDIAPGTSVPLRKQATAPAEIADAAVARQRAWHPERAVEASVEAGLPVLDVDPMLVRRVLDNLLDNAHKYTPDASAATRLAVTSDDAHVVFEVIDRGAGIAAEDLPRVFDPFFRGDRSRSRESGGVGLGLSLAKRIVEAHGGTIGITSEPGGGTTARVALPYASSA